MSADNAEVAPAPATPSHVVLDTNTILRLLVLDCGTRQSLGFLSLARTTGSIVMLAPSQEDEFWRNAPAVFEDHAKRWCQTVRDAKIGIDDLICSLKAADALRLLTEEQQEALNSVRVAKPLVDSVSEPSCDWAEFRRFAEAELPRLRHLEGNDVDALFTAARSRVDLFNPPCRSKKERPLGDCLLWELVLSLLREEDHRVWFATTDKDFSYPDRVHDLHPFLCREEEATEGTLRFFHEDRNLCFQPGGEFKIVQAFAEAAPQNVTQSMKRTMEVLGVISPGLSWRQVEDALDQLSFRQREIVKLRLGIGYGHQYTQHDIGLIFGVSQPRISQIETAATDRLLKILAATNADEED